MYIFVLKNYLVSAKITFYRQKEFKKNYNMFNNNVNYNANTVQGMQEENGYKNVIQSNHVQKVYRNKYLRDDPSLLHIMRKLCKMKYVRYCMLINVLCYNL